MIVPSEKPTPPKDKEKPEVIEVDGRFVVEFGGMVVFDDVFVQEVIEGNDQSPESYSSIDPND